MCRKRLSSPRCRFELIDSALVVIVPGQKYIKKTQMIFEDFRSFHRICDVTGGKMGEKIPKWSKTPYILTALWHRGVKLAWWVHVGMANSLVALNLEIWEILILFVTSKGKKGAKKDPKLRKKTPYLHNNCSIRVETCR